MPRKVAVVAAAAAGVVVVLGVLYLLFLRLGSAPGNGSAKPPAESGAAVQKSDAGEPVNQQEGGLTEQEKLWGMSKEELIEKFYTYDDEYYSRVDPNRIQQTRPLEPGEKRPKIKLLRGSFQYVLAGAECPKPLEVRVPPNMPCTFYAQDLGHFKENGKNCITVKADEKGIARVHYVASRGGSMIMAHSPEAIGWARFQVTGLSEKEYARMRREQPELLRLKRPGDATAGLTDKGKQAGESREE